MLKLIPKNKKQIFQIIYFCCVIGFFALLNFNQPRFISAQISPDAIAIRVQTNPNHKSALRWYRNQNFSGSPQSIEVDGYKGIRDGRTVYVNVANIDSSNTLHTNIYLISYNQEAERNTQGIYGKILEHWKFTTNIIDTGTCFNEINLNCRIDSDCKSGDYCLGEEAKIRRDVARMESLEEIENNLAIYEQNNGKYPQLSAGTYLPNKTLSTWPSWQNVLAHYLKMSLPSDPVNELGDCGSSAYHPKTCWDETGKTFADPTPDNDTFNLPNDSLAIVYTSNPIGSDYDLCATMESTYAPSANNCFSTTASNQDPEITRINVNGCLDREYSGFIQAEDPENDLMNWTLDTSGSGWAGWSAPPVLQDTTYPNQKRIYATDVTITGINNATLTISDGRGGSIVYPFTIEITDCAQLLITRVINISDGSTVVYDLANELTSPFILTVAINQGLDFLIQAFDFASQYPLVYSFSGAPNGFNDAGGLNDNEHDYTVRSSSLTGPMGLYNMDFYATDSTGENSVVVNFSININNNPPVITTVDIPNATGCQDYTTTIDAYDPDGHNITFSAAGLPDGLSLNANTGQITGQPRVPSGAFTVIVTVQDEFFSSTIPESDAQAIQAYTLNVFDEVFTITVPDDDTFYTYISSDPFLYHNFTFMDGASENTSNNISWSLSTNPASLISGLTTVIDPDTGFINATAVDSPVDADGYSYDVTVTATTEDCEVSVMDSLALNVFPNEYCGDSFIQGDYGEICDYGGDNICCVDCNLTCPPYTLMNSGFNGTSSIALSSGESTNISFPACESFVPSGQLDLEIVNDSFSIAIVFVTDTSGSMPDGMTDVKTALHDSFDALHVAVEDGYDFHVGLVRFSDTISSYEIDSLSAAHLTNLKNTVDAYTDDGWTFTDDGLQIAYNMLNNYIADIKIVVLLSDGEPSDSHSPGGEINDIKGAGMFIYAIAYTTDSALQDIMCDWSSDAVADCYSDRYSYSSVNASMVYAALINDIMSLEIDDIDLTVSGQMLNFPITENIMEDVAINLSVINCTDSIQNIPFSVNFDGSGQIIFSNLRINYCPFCP